MPVPENTPITIVIPAHNQLEYCRACIDSVRANTRRQYHLVLVNNGSTDGVGEYFDTVQGATAIHVENNMGFAAGVNVGLAVAMGHVVLLNSDTLVPPEWLARLESALLSDVRWGAVGPMTNCASGEQQLGGVVPLDAAAIATLADDLWSTHGSAVNETTRLAGFCIMLRDGVWQKVGDFDTRFGIGNFEDDDYCTRIRKEGHALGMAEGCFVFHHGGRTFAGMGLEGEAYNALLQENRQKYMEKWEVYLPSPEAVSTGRANAIAREASQAMKSGDTGRAMRLYSEAIATDPGNSQHFFGLGNVLARLGHIKLAIEAFTTGLKSAPEDDAALRRLEELRRGE